MLSNMNVKVTMVSRNFFFFVFLGPHPQHIDVPRLVVESELWLLAYVIVTATPDLSHTDIYTYRPTL